jgi:hypothetical protein
MTPEMAATGDARGADDTGPAGLELPAEPAAAEDPGLAADPAAPFTP